jgi:hypothetical protein
MNPAELFRKETAALQLAPGDFLFREGEKGDKMYVLLEGEIDIFLGDFVFETAGPGSLLGEMALIDDSPRTAKRRREEPVAPGANRPAPVSLSRSADTAFCDACDENAGRSAASHERRDGGAIASLERETALLSQSRVRRYLPANANRRAISAFCCDRYHWLRPTGPDGCRIRNAPPADGRATVEATWHQGRTRARSNGEGAA